MSLALPEETALVIPESLNEQDFENLAKLFFKNLKIF